MKKMFTALCLLFNLNVIAQTIYFVNDDASGANNGSSWTDAFTKLQDALAAAGSGDQIWVAAGIYYPDEGGGLSNNNRSHSFHLEAGVAIYGGFAGTETQLSERNLMANVSTLSGEIQQDNAAGNNAYHVVQSDNVDSTAVLNGFTITAGFAEGIEGQGNGGGIFNTGSPILTNCSISGNYAIEPGGGMYNDGASPRLINCSFSSNTAIGASGAAGVGGGMHNNNSSPRLINCTFSGNTAEATGGGFAIGGGIANAFSSPILINCSFSGNTVKATDGGFARGGGIGNEISTPVLNNCSFSGNTAEATDGGFAGGGGIANAYSSPILNNCSFSGNTASQGGGIFNISDISDPLFISSPKLTNCILWGNTTDQIVNDEGSNPVVTYSIVQGGFPGTGNLDQDPLFVDAANGDLHLQPNSPAIDAGLNSANTTSVDLDGNPRIVNSIIDMGAYEFQGESLIVSSFTLINADTDEDIKELKDGDVIDLSTLPATRLNIRANTNPETVDSVVFELSRSRGLLRYRHTDNAAPYSLFSDVNGDYLGIIPQTGEYQLKATPYSESDESGQPGTSKMLTFRVVRTSLTTSTEPKLNSDALLVKGSLKAVPNPYRGQATISFSVPQSGYTTLEVIDQRGAVVDRLYAAQAQAGQVYTLQYNSKLLKSGVYVLRLINDKYVQTYKIVLTQ